MTAGKIKEAIYCYRIYLIANRVGKQKYPEKRRVRLWEILFNRDTLLGHCLAMLDDMDKFVDEGRMEKVFRWLGFMQGVLWVLGLYSLEDLKNHNKPSDKPPPAYPH